MIEENPAWALVPLIHFERLAGVALLARPLVGRELDWEDLDMLRVVGRQVDSYKSEAHSMEALLDAQRSEVLNRLFDFVLTTVSTSSMEVVCKYAYISQVF